MPIPMFYKIILGACKRAPFFVFAVVISILLDIIQISVYENSVKYRKKEKKNDY